MIIFAKICKSKYYKDFILLFVHPASFTAPYMLHNFAVNKARLWSFLIAIALRLCRRQRQVLRLPPTAGVGKGF